MKSALTNDYPVLTTDQLNSVYDIYDNNWHLTIAKYEDLYELIDLEADSLYWYVRQNGFDVEWERKWAKEVVDRRKATKKLQVYYIEYALKQNERIYVGDNERVISVRCINDIITFDSTAPFSVFGEDVHGRMTIIDAELRSVEKIERFRTTN